MIVLLGFIFPLVRFGCFDARNAPTKILRATDEYQEKVLCTKGVGFD